MPAAEIGQMSAVGARHMYSIRAGQSLVAIVDICLVSTVDIGPVLTADTCPVPTTDIRPVWKAKHLRCLIRNLMTSVLSHQQTSCQGTKKISIPPLT